MFTIRKLFKFEASHRLKTSYSKCCQLIHGHSYRVEVFLSSKKLNKDGTVIDFGMVKDIIKKFIEQFDHKLILCEDDNGFLNYISEENIIIIKTNPTAENMAQFFFRQIKNEFKRKKIKVLVKKIRVWETETGYAEYEE